MESWSDLHRDALLIDWELADPNAAPCPLSPAPRCQRGPNHCPSSATCSPSLSPKPCTTPCVQATVAPHGPWPGMA